MATGVITAVAATTNDRVAVELDGRRWVTLDALRAAALGVAQGVILDPAQRAAIEDAAREERALARAAGMVARRSHARGELEARVARRDGPEAARIAAERLADLGVLDDERHAADLAAHRLAQGWGPLRVAHDLEAAGVDAALVRATVEGLDPDAVDDAARRAVGTRAGIEAWRRLAARGFDEETAERVAGPLEDG